MRINYRPEIDGLRAIAVIAVILYHAQINLFNGIIFPGGFIGVDIFFVISGYLITSLITKELIKTEKFSFTYFNSTQYNKIDTKKNILNLAEPRDSIFFDENLFSERTISIVKVYNENIYKDKSLENNFLNKFIINNEIQFIIANNKEKIPNCLKTIKVEDINYKLAVRNYLRKDRFEKIGLFRIKSNNC